MRQLKAIARFSNGDARTALNTLEMAVLNGEISASQITVTDEVIAQCTSRRSLLYDKKWGRTLQSHICSAQIHEKQ